MSTPSRPSWSERLTVEMTCTIRRPRVLDWCRLYRASASSKVTRSKHWSDEVGLQL